jgi:hypothetical protein
MVTDIGLSKNIQILFGDKNMKKIAKIFSIIFFIFVQPLYSGTWATIDYPGFYISGNKICNGNLLYDGQNWTTLNAPGATRTEIRGISGNRIIGYSDNSLYGGFLYDGQTWTTLDLPGGIDGIDGDNIIVRSTPKDIYIYNISSHTLTSLNMLGLWEIVPYGISGNKVVGEYYASSDFHSFFYDGTIWIELNMPGAITTTHARDIDGSNIVGYYDYSGFLYDGSTWTSLNYPGAIQTLAYGISGDKITGSYRIIENGHSVTHGFIYTIPEPASASIVLISCLLMIMRKRKR